jgi:hypothetical protein
VTLGREIQGILLRFFDDAISPTNGVSSGASANCCVACGYEVLHYGVRKLSTTV